MNPNDETDRGRLSRAVEWSWKQLEPFRRLTHGLVSEYAGSGYGNGSRRPKFEILVNLLNQTVDAYVMELVANRPRVTVTARTKKLRYFALQYETALNNLAAEIQLEQTLRQAVMDAFFCVGIVKLHMADSVEVQLETDLWANPGTPFASNVSIDNWVHDMAATKYSKVQFAGDSYRIPFEDLKSDMFDQEVIKELELRPTSKWSSGGEDDRLERISRGDETDQDELVPMIDVLDLWVPREGMIFTFPVDPKMPFRPNSKPIGGIPWNGPEFGPYPMLSFNEIPDNIMPSSPASHLSGMARIINNIARKQARRAHGQKDIFTYTPAGAESHERVKNASDQQSVCVAEQSELGVMKLGGVDANLQAYLVGLMQTYDRMAGNLTAMLGLGPQAETAAQEGMIQGNVSKRGASMLYRVGEFSCKILRGLGFMLWSDKAKVIPGAITVPGMDDYKPLDATWTPGDRQGQFSDYEVGIDVGSMPYQHPAKKFGTMMSLLQNVFLPAAPMMAQQGGRINFEKVTKSAAKLLDAPEIEEWFEFSALAQPPGEEGSEEESGSPPSTTRNYVRQSVSGGGTTQGQSTMEQQAWLSKGQGEGASQESMVMGGA